MNVEANHTKNINNMNIYITHSLGYNPANNPMWL